MNGAFSLHGTGSSNSTMRVMRTSPIFQLNISNPMDVLATENAGFPAEKPAGNQ
jgi:hypothetical protein